MSTSETGDNVDTGRWGPDSDPLYGFDRRPWFIHDYQLLREIGQSPTSSTVLARHTDSGTSAVIRFLFRAGLKSEALARAQVRGETFSLLHNTHLTTIRACRVSAHGLAIIYEFVDGVSARELVHSANGISLLAAASLAVQCLAGIQAAHAVGLMHGNVTDESIVIDAYGHVRLLGCRLLDAGTETALTDKHPHPLGDVEAIGLLLTEILTAAPQAATNGGAETKHTTDDGTKDTVVALIQQALTMNTAEQPLRAAALNAVLRECVASAAEDGWEEQGRQELARIVAHSRAGSPTTVLTRRQGSKRPLHAGVVTALILLTTCAATVIHLSSPDGKQDSAFAPIPWGATSSLPESPTSPNATPGASNTSSHSNRSASPGDSTTPSNSIAPTDTRSLNSLDTIVSPHGRNSSTPERRGVSSTLQGQQESDSQPNSVPTPEAPASDLIESVSISTLEKKSPSSAQSVVTIHTRSTAAFEVTISWYDPGTGGTMAAPGAKDGSSWTVPLSGANSYTVTSSHDFSDSNCRFAVRAVSAPGAIQDNGYAKLDCS